MKIALYIIGYFMMVLIAFYVLCIVDSDDVDDDIGVLVTLSFVWPALIAVGILILPFKVMNKAAEATVKSLEKRKRENNEH
jgi:hypothetical protein